MSYGVHRLMENRVTWHITDPRDACDLFIVYNSRGNRYVNLPAGSWMQVANANGATDLGNLSTMALVEGAAVTIFRKLR